MAMPTVTAETALAVLDKMTKDASDPCLWTLENAESFIAEQPNLFFTVIENIKQLYPDGEGGAVQASKSLYLAMVTYKLLKAAVEGEQLNELFGEDDHE
jgi:hypothetical protein